MYKVPPNTLLDSHQAAALLNVEPATLHAWRYRGYGPSWVVIGKRCIRYRFEEIVDYIKSGEVVPDDKNLKWM